MSDFKINSFSEYVLRTPLFPLSAYLGLLKGYSSEKAVEFYKDPVIKEAINLASPELRQQLDKWAAEMPTLSQEKKTGLELSFLKYVARMSSRCTPFGLFAGCSVGSLHTAATHITLNSITEHTRFTQFDMQYWVAMLQDTAKRKKVAPHLKYFPNSSIYEIGDFFRFIEYKYVGTKREHTISALRKSDLLKQILLQRKSGRTVDEMVLFLAADASEKKEAQAFIQQLISFQFLVSELDAAVTGTDEWKRVFSILDTIPLFGKEIRLLENLKEKLSDLDATLVPKKESYEQVKQTIEAIETRYEEKYLFQTDLNTATLSNNLNKNVSRKVLKAIQFLNGIQVQKKSENLENFKKAFLKRYESKEMPLATVLDTEIGIGYLQNQEMNDTHEILENFSFRPKQSKEKKQIWTAFDYILQKKLHNCLFNNEENIVLTEKDFPDFDDHFKNTPITFSVMIELFNEDKIALTSAGNISAAKLLGRFCNGNTAIHNLTKEIVKKEEEYHHDKILAEIVHIPESRTGNILKRPILRKHEISYLCTPGVARENNLDLDDLYIAVKSQKIVLRSRKHNKEVLPYLSNAHNFSKNSLPLYHFLGDLGLQHKKPAYSFSWGVLETDYDFFPRVIYNDIILSKAKWRVRKEEIVSFYQTDQKLLTEAFFNWRSGRNIPRFANWVHSDNTLLFDFESPIGIALFLNAVKQKEDFFLEEFLFTEKSVVKNNTGDSFSNQIILSYFKEKV
ncbi:lantibiotic dehydratase family protein [Flavobacterium sp. Fl-318]|uniref:Lantibiotic dehydratase family protein n=1 Tax=Flavobacterium cupriresistens TaxID=2893885 RepID=A0ABU4RH35_9FLAO|nr:MULTISPECIES: lantibiotic dehydratase family protein [unclassified Flavobacterium]MDX6191268.1 lantibiotic dehydratase family protein [Flavobacterium sp. Fl-318]UFH42413.1 lantibiotic dehydratase family protein [Flavobacterium sp. F-323]